MVGFVIYFMGEDFLLREEMGEILLFSHRFPASRGGRDEGKGSEQFSWKNEEMTELGERIFRNFNPLSSVCFLLCFKI